MGERLDSVVGFSIPREGMEIDEYQTWLVDDVLRPWFEAEGGKTCPAERMGPWNGEGRIWGEFGGKYIDLKFHKNDGTGHFPRGIRIREHYSERDVEEVHHAGDRLEAFLQAANIPYERENPTLPAHVRT